MKGMSQALTIVVTAIILLIIAVVVVTIFSGAIAPVGGLAEARNNCIIQGKASCAATNSLPDSWNTLNQRGPSGSMTSCAIATQCPIQDCDCVRIL